MTLFDGTNFRLWETRTYDALALRKLMHTIRCGMPDRPSDQEMQDDCKARTLIAGSLCDSVMQRIPLSAHKDAWNLLGHIATTYYQTSRLIAMVEWSELRYKESNSKQRSARLRAVHEYLLKMSGLRYEAGGDNTLSNDVHCARVLSGLGDEHKQLSVRVLARIRAECNGAPSEEVLHEMIIEDLAMPRASEKRHQEAKQKSGGTEAVHGKSTNETAAMHYLRGWLC